MKRIIIICLLFFVTWIIQAQQTQNYVTKFNSSLNLINSSIFDNGSGVGIGTTSPAYKLHVAGDIYADGGWLRVSGGQGIYWESYGGGWYMGDATWLRNYNQKPLYIYGNGTVSAAFDNGNVGIGATNPSYPLQISKVGSTGESIRTENGTAFNLMVTKASGNGAWNPLTKQNDNLFIWNDGNVDASVNGLVIAPWSSSAKGLRIDGVTGNVGIGVTSPGYKLEVAGDVYANQGALLVSKSSNEGGSVAIYNHTKTNSSQKMFYTIYNMTGIYGDKLSFWGYPQAGLGYGTERFSIWDDGSFSFYNSTGVNTMSILNNGNVEVAGQIKITGGTPGTGKVLTSSDAYGLATWQTPNTSGIAWQLTGNSGTTPSTNFIGTTNSKDLVFKTYNVERMRIDSVGKVHIACKVILGPSSISAEQLQVAGNALFVEPGFSLNEAPLIRGGHTYTTKTTPDYTWYNDNQTGIFHPALKEIGITTGGSGGFRIDSTGHVGIGIYHSASIFHVNEGTGTFGAKTVSFSNGINDIFIVSKLGDASYDSLSVEGDKGIFWADNVNGTNSNAGFVIAPYSNKNYGIRITSDGNVGIGTSLDTNNVPNRNPQHYKLAVNGNIGAKEVFVEITSTTWPDYVFDKKYNLLPLTEVESFIKTNKHLPDVPDANEINEKGIAVGDMNAKLLKKVEELTLYLIEQNKIINNQQSIINESKERINTLESKIK